MPVQVRYRGPQESLLAVHLDDVHPDQGFPVNPRGDGPLHNRSDPSCLPGAFHGHQQASQEQGPCQDMFYMHARPIQTLKHYRSGE